MKAERKHELQQNELDSLLRQAVAFLRENGIVIGILAGAGAVVIIAYTFFFNERSLSEPAGAWNDYFTALSDPDATNQLEDFVDDAKGSTDPPALWGRLSLADKLAARGTAQLFDDRKAAEGSLMLAERHYRAVEKAAGNVAELRDRARIGLAAVYESQNQLDEALQYYDKVLHSSPDSPFAAAARRGKERLSKAHNREFLVWFAQQEPVRKPFRPSGPFDFHDLPESPTFNLPPLDSGGSERPITPGLNIPLRPEDVQEIPGTAPPETTPPPPLSPDDAPAEQE